MRFVNLFRRNLFFSVFAPVFLILSSFNKAEAVETPTAVYFDAVSSYSITASAYAPSGFTGLETGLAGAVVAKDGVYAAWRNGNVWVSKAAMPAAGGELTAAALGSKLYVLGGNPARNYEYNPGADSWTPKTTDSVTRVRPSAAAAGGKVYAIGGMIGPPYATVNNNQEYAPETNSWTTKAVLPTGRFFTSVSEAGGKLYVIGGQSVTESLTLNQEYDPVSNTWTDRAAMLTARNSAVAGSSFLTPP